MKSRAAQWRIHPDVRHWQRKRRAEERFEITVSEYRSLAHLCSRSCSSITSSTGPASRKGFCGTCFQLTVDENLIANNTLFPKKFLWNLLPTDRDGNLIPNNTLLIVLIHCVGKEPGPYPRTELGKHTNLLAAELLNRLPAAEARLQTVRLSRGAH